jgi:hypothetical protein
LITKKSNSEIGVVACLPPVLWLAKEFYLSEPLGEASSIKPLNGCAHWFPCPY